MLVQRRQHVSRSNEIPREQTRHFAQRARNRIHKNLFTTASGMRSSGFRSRGVIAK